MTLFQKIQTVNLGVFAILAILVIIDYEWPGETYTENAVSESRILENKYSTGRNYYFARRVQTEHFDFQVSDDFATTVEEGDRVLLEVSTLFKEVNEATLIDKDISEVHSFRIASGLVFPLIVLFVLYRGYKKKEKVNALVFATQVAFLANFIYLLN